MQTETHSVRPTEHIDEKALAVYLRLNMPDAVVPGLDLSRDPTLTQFAGGHSNLTYLARFGGAELVVRRPPLGPVAPKAHDMAREYHWLAALHPVFPLAPRPFLLCEDPHVLGAVFYVMERRRGIVVRHDEPLGLSNRPEERRRVSEALVDTLADLHAVDATRAPISGLGKPAGFVGRQVHGWTERWQRSKTTDIPEMDRLASLLAKRVPPDPVEPSVVHGDFKLDNVLLDPLDLGHVAAVFDWEMCALGDPLVDLGILLAYWSPTAPPEQQDALTVVTNRPGYLTRGEILDRYARRSGRDLSTIKFYETFALFKIAVVIQQIYFRYKRGQTDDPRFAQLDVRVRHLAKQGALARQLG